MDPPPSPKHDALVVNYGKSVTTNLGGPGGPGSSVHRSCVLDATSERIGQRAVAVALPSWEGGVAASSMELAYSASVGNGPNRRSRSRRICANGLSEVVSRVCNGGSARPSLDSAASVSDAASFGLAGVRCAMILPKYDTAYTHSHRATL